MIEWITLGIIAFFILAIIIIIGWGIGTFNTLVSAQQDVANGWSNIKVEYQRRADLLMNLVETTKSYKNHEKEVLIKVTEARQGNFGNSRKQEEKTMNEFDKVFSKMLLTFEQYPNLKSNEQHNKLMDEIAFTENRINDNRMEFNNIVNDYNNLVKQFPTSYVAEMKGFKIEKYFENEQGTEKAPKINLN